MKAYRFINTKVSIASFMVGNNTNKMTYSDLYDWSVYLGKKLSNEDCKTIVFFGKEYIDELKRDDDGFLFEFGENTIKLAKYKGKYDLDKHVFAYVDADLLLDLFKAQESYNKKNNELTL